MMVFWNVLDIVEGSSICQHIEGNVTKAAY